jgi:hypothetical protein
MKKTQLLFAVVEEVLSKCRSVFYLDFDLQFSSALSFKLGKGRFHPDNNLHTMVFGESGMLDMWTSLVSTEPSEPGGIIVLDSLNSLLDLLRGRDSLRSNHEASVLLTLLQQYARDYSLLLIISDIVRSKPAGGADSSPWEKEIAGGRMIRSKSDVIISVKEGSGTSRSGTENLEVVIDYASPRVRNKVTLGEEFSIDISSIT